VLAWFGPYRRPQESGLIVAVTIAFFGLGATGVTEWVREAVRKPYIIYGYMYSNGIRVADADRIATQGILQTAKWVSVRDPQDADWKRVGFEIFRSECRSCHTVDGYNGIRLMVKGWREDFVDYQLQHLNELKGFMPPFIGTPAERRALARWLAYLGRSRPISEGLEVAQGFERREKGGAR
jgi:mono/diheme cytochrome c family protein